MARHTRTGLAAAMMVIAAMSAAPMVRAAEDPSLTSLRAEVGFASWPGQGGALKKGLVFTPADYPGLAGYIVLGDDVDSRGRDLGIVREVRLENGGQDLTVIVGVTPASTNNAHEMLFQRALASSHMAFADRLKRGDLNGISSGDLNFVSAAATSGDAKGYVAFVRNNIVVLVEDGRPVAASTVDLIQLAQAIDAKIVALPDLTPSEFDALRPSIATFSPTSATLVAAEGSSTTMNIVINDPAGEPVRSAFESGGELDVDDAVPPVTVRSTDVVGSITLWLIATNASLQFGTAQTVFTVNPGP